MSEQELEKLLIDKCTNFDLKKKAFEILEQIFCDPDNDKKVDFWCGFEKSDIKRIFDGFTFHVEKRHLSSIIRARIGLYVENSVWLNNLEPIGYYELEAGFTGEILDDWFVIEKEKHLNEVEIIGHFKSLNNNLPPEYLKRNHIQYELVSYVSLIGTFFMSKNFEAAATFVQRTHTYLETTDNTLIDKGYLKEVKIFLKKVKSFLVTNNLLPDE